MPPSNLLLASKIVVVEEPPAIRNIQGVATAIAAFVGVTERGPMRVPQFVTGWDSFVEKYGSYISTSDLPIAVQGFFLNGGTGAWISRAQHYTDINDNLTGASAKGTQTLLDRGGAAAAAILDSNAGPFQILPGDVLEVNIDGAGADTLTFTATQALAVTVRSIAVERGTGRHPGVVVGREILGSFGDAR